MSLNQGTQKIRRHEQSHLNRCECDPCEGNQKETCPVNNNDKCKDENDCCCSNNTVNKIFFLDEVCDLGDSTYLNTEGYDWITDDHVPAYNLGIPAIDIIDARYGQNASDPIFGGHWHTQNDTADKVSAESLQKIGYILESGLITGSWLNIREVDVENQIDDDSNQTDTETEDVEVIDEDEDEVIIGVLMMACILLVWGNLAWIIFADTRGEG